MSSTTDDAAYNQARNSWQTAANRYNTYLQEKNTWDALDAEYQQKAADYQNGIHLFLSAAGLYDDNFSSIRWASYIGYWPTSRIIPIDFRLPDLEFFSSYPSYVNVPRYFSSTTFFSFSVFPESVGHTPSPIGLSLRFPRFSAIFIV